MDAIIAIAISAHIITVIVAFIGADFTYWYIKRSERFFVVKEQIPFLTLGIAGFGVASIVDIFSLLSGMSMVLSIGTLIRMFSLIFIMGGAIILRRLIEHPERRPSPEVTETQIPKDLPKAS